MQKLIKGLHKFQTEVFPIQKNFFQQLAKGQSPETLFITCSDSRIDPRLVTSAEPGDLFIIRNAGTIIPPYAINNSETATIEFAVSELKVKHIIICGHSHCGAVEAVFAINTFDHIPHFKAWINNYVVPSLHFVHKNYPLITDRISLLNVLLQEHVLRQLENLKTHPLVTNALAQKKITLHAWIYKFEQGEIFSFNQDNEQFERIKS